MSESDFDERIHDKLRGDSKETFCQLDAEKFTVSPLLSEITCERCWSIAAWGAACQLAGPDIETTGIYHRLLIEKYGKGGKFKTWV